MNSDTGAKRAYPIDDRSRGGDGWTIELAANEASARLSGRLSVIAVLLLSLALWAAIWAAVASLAAPTSL
ncbi:MAG TPA: hypothetical protein VGF34_09125 [Stellaceae bacterium]|jgi:hypothetical protein